MISNQLLLKLNCHENRQECFLIWTLDQYRSTLVLFLEAGLPTYSKGNTKRINEVLKDAQGVNPMSSKRLMRLLW